MTRPASLEDVLEALDAQEAVVGRLEDRVGRLEAAAGADAAGVDGVRQREVVQDSDYEQSLHSERERQAEHDRDVDR